MRRCGHALLRAGESASAAVFYADIIKKPDVEDEAKSTEKAVNIAMSSQKYLIINGRHQTEATIMRERRQEKIGWVGGWLGAFVWVLLLSVSLLVRGETWPAVIGLLICAMAFAAIGFFAPWRHPRTTYRRLLAPLYVIFFCAVGWGVWSFGGLRQIGIHSWWSLPLLMPIMMPLWMGGNRRWQDNEAHPPHAADGTSRRR